MHKKREWDAVDMPVTCVPYLVSSKFANLSPFSSPCCSTGRAQQQISVFTDKLASKFSKRCQVRPKIIKEIKIGKVFYLLSSTCNWANSWSSLYGQLYWHDFLSIQTRLHVSSMANMPKKHLANLYPINNLWVQRID